MSLGIEARNAFSKSKQDLTDITTDLALYKAETTLNGKYFKFETISDMVDGVSKLEIGDIIELAGYYSIGDGGGHNRVISGVNNLLSITLGSGLYANVYGAQDDLRYFGIIFDNEGYKTTNASILKNVLAFYNGFAQKEELRNNIVYTLDFYHTIASGYFNYQNINLRVEILLSIKPYIIGIESNISYITMKNFSIRNSLTEIRENIYKIYAVKLADNISPWGGVKYCIEDAILTGFSVPLFVNTWAGSIKNINFFMTDTGCILLGTSTEVSSIYVNKSLYGNVLGAVYDIASDTFSTPAHAVFVYSTLGALANDFIEKNVMIVGNTKAVTILSIGAEAPVAGAQSIFKPLASQSYLNIISADFSALANDIPMYIVYADTAIVFTLNIRSMRNTSIAQVKNQSTLVVNIEHDSSYRVNNFTDNKVGKLILNNNQVSLSGTPNVRTIGGLSKNLLGGGSVAIKGCTYEVESFVTCNQRLKMVILPILWSSTVVARRNFFINAQVAISDVDAQSRTIENTYFIKCFISTFTTGVSVITPVVKRLNADQPDLLVVSVDNTGSYPVLVLQMPVDIGTNPGSYFLSGKIATGTTSDYVNNVNTVSIENY